MAWLAQTGLSHDKRRIAEYMRSVFFKAGGRKHGGDEFAGDPGDDEELVLEKALPRPDPELRVDPEDHTDHHVSIHDAATAPIDTEAGTGRVTRTAEVDVLPMADSETAPLRADDTQKRIRLETGTAPQPWWRRFWNFLRGK
jgi:hypothetical protein